MTQDASNTTIKANLFFNFLFKYVHFALGIIMLFIFGYLLMIGSGVGLAFGLYALLIYIICFVGGIYLTTLLISNSQHPPKIIGLGSIIFALMLIVIGQQYKWFDGLRSDLTIQGVGNFLSSYILAFNCAFVTKNLLARWRSLRGQRNTIVHLPQVIFANLLSSLMIGVVNGILLCIAWATISVSFGIKLGIGLGLAISVFHFLATNHEISEHELKVK